MTDQKTGKRPAWATLIGNGFFVAAFGALLLAIGFFLVPYLIGFGAAVVALGAMVSFIGAYGYFMELRR